MSNASYLTPKQLADRWSITTGTLANWRSQGRGPAFGRIGSRVRYRVEDVTAFEAAGQVKAEVESND